MLYGAKPDGSLSLIALDENGAIKVVTNEGSSVTDFASITGNAADNTSLVDYVAQQIANNPSSAAFIDITGDAEDNISLVDYVDQQIYNNAQLYDLVNSCILWYGSAANGEPKIVSCDPNNSASKSYALLGVIVQRGDWPTPPPVGYNYLQIRGVAYLPKAVGVTFTNNQSVRLNAAGTATVADTNFNNDTVALCIGGAASGATACKVMLLGTPGQAQD